MTNYMPKPHLKTLLLLCLGHHNIDFGGTQTFNLKHPPLCWLLLDVEASSMLVREYWNKGEDGLYRSSRLTDINKSTPLVHILLPSEWLLLPLLCFTSLLCSTFFPKESTLPTQTTHASAAAEFHWPCSFCVFPFWSILDFVTSYILYFYQLNFCFIFTLKTFWYYFYLKSIVENPWKYAYLQ